MLSDTIGFYSVKAIAIFIISIVYFLLGSTTSIVIDQYLPEDSYHQMSTFQLFLHISGMMGIIAVAFYGMRHIVKRIPFFMDGWYGFNASKLSEIGGGIIIAHTVYIYQKRLIGMMEEFGRRMRRIL